METMVHSCEHTQYGRMYILHVLIIQLRVFRVYIHGYSAHHHRLCLLRIQMSIQVRSAKDGYKACRNDCLCSGLWETQGWKQVHSPTWDAPRIFLRKKQHFSRLVSILPSLLKRSNGFLSSLHKLMQFTKTGFLLQLLVNPVLWSW